MRLLLVARRASPPRHVSIHGQLHNSTQRRLRLEGAANLTPEASRWRAKVAAPAQYLKFLSLRSKPLSNYAQQHLSCSCCKRLSTQVGFAAQYKISRGTIIESVHRGALSAAAFCFETAPLPRQVFTGPAELPLCTALVHWRKYLPHSATD